MFELNTSLDELVSLSLNGLILNLRPSSEQLPSFPSLRVPSVDMRMFNNHELPNWSMPAFLSALISNCPKIEQISLIDETHVHQSCAEIKIPSTCLRLAVNAELLADCRVMRNLNELIVDASSLEDFIACNKFLSQNLSSLNLENFCLRMTQFKESWKPHLIQLIQFLLYDRQNTRPKHIDIELFDGFLPSKSSLYDQWPNTRLKVEVSSASVSLVLLTASVENKFKHAKKLACCLERDLSLFVDFFNAE